MKEGLELELEDKDLSFDGKTWFLKIHIPWKTKTRYAAVMNMKFPTKRFIPISVKAWVCSNLLANPSKLTRVLIFFQADEKNEEKNQKFITKWQKKFREIFEYDHSLIDEDPSFYMATQGDREEQLVFV